MNRISYFAKYLRRPFLVKAYGFIGAHKMVVAAAILLTMLFIMFTKTVVALTVLVMMAVPTILITTYKRFVRLPPALELISITTVMATIFYGPIVGIIYTILVNLGAEVASGHPDEMTLTYFPSRSLQVLFIHFAYKWGLTGIPALGIWSVVVFNAVQQPIFMSLVDIEKRLKSVYFVMLNIPLNIFIFKVFGPPLFSLLKLVV